MKISRESLLQVLEQVEAGLATKEVVEQSSCYVFTGSEVVTFSGEVCARVKLAAPVQGAVSARHLKELLVRITEDEIKLATADDNLRISSKGGRGSIAMQAEVRLPIDQVETPAEDAWGDLHPEFADAVDVVGSAAAKNDQNYKLLCVHCTPDHLEACDNYQLARYPLQTGLTACSMVRRDSLRHVVALGMTEVSETETWLHFRNPAGLVVSMRRWSEDYENLDSIIAGVQDTQPTTLPGGIEEAVQRTGVFSGDNGAASDVVRVDLLENEMRLRGEGAGGWWEERKRVKYAGPKIGFLIAPRLLLELGSKGQECDVSRGALRVDTGKFTYITATTAGE